MKQWKKEHCVENELVAVLHKDSDKVHYVALYGGELGFTLRSKNGVAKVIVDGEFKKRNQESTYKNNANVNKSDLKRFIDTVREDLVAVYHKDSPKIHYIMKDYVNKAGFPSPETQVYLRDSEGEWIKVNGLYVNVYIKDLTVVK